MIIFFDVYCFKVCVPCQLGDAVGKLMAEMMVSKAKAVG